MGLYARWRLDETSGIVVPDDSGNGRDGTTVNMEDADWVPGRVNNCLVFDGANEYVNCGNIAGFERTDPFSVGCWVKTVVDNKQVVSKIDHVAPFRGWSMYMAGGKLACQLTNDNSPSNRIVLTGDTVGLDDGVWHYMAATYDGSSAAAGVALYVDGEPETPTVLADTLTGTILNAINCQVAARNGSNDALDGYVDEVNVYDGELSAAEITTLYHSYFGEIDLKGNGVSIANGDAEPRLADYTDFGLVDLVGTKNRIFTIENAGAVDLDLTGAPIVAVSGTHAAEFVMIDQPATPVPGSGSDTFTVRFDPAGEGMRFAALTIENSDPDEDPYVFAIGGTGGIAIGGGHVAGINSPVARGVG